MDNNNTPITTPNKDNEQTSSVTSAEAVTPTVQETSTVNNLNDVEKNDAKNEKKKNIIFYAIYAIVLIFVIACIVFFLLTEMNKKSDSDNTQKPGTDQVENTEQNDQDGTTTPEDNQQPETPIETVDLASWNGVYTLGKTKITINQSGLDLVTVSIVDEDGALTAFDTEVESDNKINYADDFFGEETSVVIEKTDNGIKITSSSSDSNSSLNKISGSYTKTVFTPYGWSGNYVNGDITIIINEIDKDYVSCSVIKGMSVASFTIDKVSATELTYEDKIDQELVTITKTDNGINVTASAADKDSILSSINGTYTLK